MTLISRRKASVLVLLLLVPSAPFSQGLSEFRGSVITEWLAHDGHDRNMRLVTDFGFIDSSGQLWDVPADAIVDGASIPRVLWSPVGSPFVGDYRRASVVHDYYCVVQSAPKRATHRMFREAAIAGGVNTATANTMYGAIAVYWIGTPWGDEDGARDALARRSDRSSVEFRRAEAQRSAVVDEFMAWANETTPDLAEIDGYLDTLAAQ